MSFVDSGFARFMSGATGRIIRVVAGLAIIAWGVMNWGTTAGKVVAVVGLVPLIAGSFNLCLLSGLLGGIWSGKTILSKKS